MMSHPALMDRKSLHWRARCLKKAAGSFPGSFKPAGLVAQESKCPGLKAELIKSENWLLIGSKCGIIAL